jgi:hypothetical protein
MSVSQYALHLKYHNMISSKSVEKNDIIVMGARKHHSEIADLPLSSAFERINLLLH